MTVTPIFPVPHEGINHTRNLYKNLITEDNHVKERFIKPIGDLYPLGSDWREIAEIISKVILDENKHYRY